MTVTSQDLKNAAALLRTLRTSQEVKLRYGSMKRQELREQLAKGEDPTGYRAEWLRERRNEIVKQLGQFAKDFNAQYPHDCCSLQDLKDVVVSVLNYIEVVQKS